MDRQGLRPCRSVSLGVRVRHDVAQFECIQAVALNTRYVPTEPYAGVLPPALMTGCEALRTMYRNGFKW